MVVVVVVVLVLAGLVLVRTMENREEATPAGARQVEPPPSGAPASSVHGDDYSVASPDGRTLTTCDVEEDGNPVRGVFDFDPATDGGDGEIDDTDGAGGRCAGIRADRPIRRHRTCERNLVAWDCDNWTSID